jgi:hypothetical protein
LGWGEGGQLHGLVALPYAKQPLVPIGWTPEPVLMHWRKTFSATADVQPIVCHCTERATLCKVANVLKIGILAEKLGLMNFDKFQHHERN